MLSQHREFARYINPVFGALPLVFVQIDEGK